MGKKSKKPFIEPQNLVDKKKALDELKKKNIHLDDEANGEIKGGFLERGRSHLPDEDFVPSTDI